MGGLQAKSMTSQRAEPSKMAAICYYGNVTFAVEDVYTELVIDVFYIFNSTVID